jgi:hypothetical protein
MKTIAVEDIYISIIQTFCENLAELGYRPDIVSGDPTTSDMWWRYLSYKQQRKVVEKMIEIEERYVKQYNTKKDKKPSKRK